jgi:hypothetical protein
MPPRRISQHLSRPEDEAPPPPSNQAQPPTQTLLGIIEGHEHEAFTEIEEIQLQHATNIGDTSIGAAGSSQNVEGTGSSQNDRGVPHHSPSRAPSPGQVIQEHIEFKKHQVEDWEDEVLEDKAVEEEELTKVQQEIEGLRQEQETIIRRSAAT